MTDIPSSVLSEAFQGIIKGRRLRAAVFLTFQFEPGFFEQEVLPAFFDIPLSPVPEMRLLALAEELRKVDGIAVYYDRAALVAGSGSSQLDVQRVGVSPPTGYFHPKVVLVLLDDALIVASLSANLTRAGWWENVEVAHLEEVVRDTPCSFRADLAALIRRVRRSAAHVEHHEALDAIGAFVGGVVQDEQRKRASVILPRLFFGDRDVVDFLVEVAGSRLQRCNLEILSPFFDDTGSARPVERLKEAFRPKAIRLFLPRNAQDEALCSAEYYQRVRGLDVQWGHLPAAVMRLTNDLDRRLHAKVYRFFDRDRGYEAFFAGSANLTNAGLGRGGNVESGFFVEVPARKPDWWLIRDDDLPTFASRSESAPLEQGRGWRLSVRYRWSDGNAGAYWDDAADSPPLILLSHGVEAARLASFPGRGWMPLGSDAAKAIGEALISGSFLTVRIAGEADAQILVEEEEMTHKPSLLARVTAADILHYWSLLSPEQKKEFFEEHAEAFDDPELSVWLGARPAPPGSDRFFSTFAEIYLSFGNLRRSVAEALDAGRPREAVDRLFGRKFDSLWRLIERVTGEHDTDTVRRYVILLCARQLLDLVEHDHPEFCATHREDLAELRIHLGVAFEVRKTFAFDGEAERDQFFHWFDRRFLLPARPIRETR
jgi:hypothetical protein